MKFMSFCRSCGRAVENEFVFCPWCGVERFSSAANTAKNRESGGVQEPSSNALSQELIDEVFIQLEEKQSSNRNKRVRVMESKLEALEKELDTLALIAETHECQQKHKSDD